MTTAVCCPPALACTSAAPAAARALLQDDRLVVLATRTTGLLSQSDLAEIALLNRHGQVLLHTRIRPRRLRLPELLDAELADLPPLDMVWPALAALLTNWIIASAHITDDRHLLRQTARRVGATLMYAEWCDVPARTRLATGGREPCALPSACDAVPSLPASALTTARATLAALRALTDPLPADPPARRIFWRYLR